MYNCNFTGCARALFCKLDASGNLRVFQLSADHILSNEDELNRLASLEVDIEHLKIDGQIGNHSYTRTIGDYHIKGNYKEVKGLRYGQVKFDLLVMDGKLLMFLTYIIFELFCVKWLSIKLRI